MINFIGSGEIIQNVKSFVKETIENSIDANATQIMKKISKVVVQDNGDGINSEDFAKLCQRYYTSKISQYNELQNIQSLGFRGEALNAIAQNSKLTVISNNKENSNLGFKAIFVNSELVGDKNGKYEPVAHQKGTTLMMENLFYKNSKRQSFLGGVEASVKDIEFLIKCYSIQFEKISFKFKVNTKLVFESSSNSNLVEKFQESFEELKNVKIESLEDSLESKTLDYSIYYTKPNEIKNKKIFILFINNRLGKYPELKKVISQAYNVCTQTISKDLSSFFVFMKIKIHHTLLDFNLSANKQEVKIVKEKQILKLIEESFIETLSQKINVKTFTQIKPSFNSFNFDIKQELKKPVYYQRNDHRDTKLTYYSQSQQRDTKINTIYKKPYTKDLQNVQERSIIRDKRPGIRTNEQIDRFFERQIVKKESQIQIEQNVHQYVPIIQSQQFQQENYDTQNTNESDISSQLVMESTFVGAFHAFGILLQYKESLAQMSTINFVKKYFISDVHVKRHNQNVPQKYQVFKKDHLIDLEYIQQNFGRFCSFLLQKYCQNDIQNLYQQLDDFDQIDLEIPNYKRNKDNIVYIIEEEFVPYISDDHLQYLQLLFFQQFLQQKKNSLETHLKFQLYVLNSIKIENLNEFYERILTDLKKSFFCFQFTNPEEEIKEVTNTKILYKIFERC